jgi:hypothetical protein
METNNKKPPRIIEFSLIALIVIVALAIIFIVLPSKKKPVVSKVHTFYGTLKSTEACFQNISCSVKVDNTTVDTSINGSSLLPGQLKGFTNNVISTKYIGRTVLVRAVEINSTTYSIANNSNYYIELQN